MWEYKHTDELYHYGVLGMRWGVRRNRPKGTSYLARKRKERKDRISEDSKNVTNIRKKKVREMSNQELKEVNKRLELETKYNELSNKKLTGQRVVQAFIATGMTLGTIEVAAKNYKKVGDFVIKKLGKRAVK